MSGASTVIFSQRPPGQLTAFLVLWAISGPAFAVTNWQFMQDSFLFGLSERDAADFKATVGQLLSESPDAEALSWRSADGQRAGKVVPRFTYESNGEECRRTEFTLQKRGGRLENYQLDLCNQQTGWAIVEAPDGLDEADQQASTAVLRKALSEQAADEPIVWVSDTTGSSATIVMVDPVLSGDTGCRAAAISLLDGEGRTASGRYRFCRDEAGNWSYSPP